MLESNFSRRAALRVREQIRVPQTIKEIHKLQWAEAVLSGDDETARISWESYRRAALSDVGTPWLTRNLAELRGTVRQAIPSATLAIQDRAVIELERSGIAETCLRAGDTAPDFALPNVWGRIVSLGDLVKKGPLIVNFYRGNWCPFCNSELRHLEDKLPRIAELGANLVSISPQTLDQSMATAEKINLSHQVLSDPGNQVARRFGIVFTLPGSLRPIFEDTGVDLRDYNGDDTFELPLPATFVIDGNRTIRMAFTEADHTERIDPELVIELIQKMVAVERGSSSTLELPQDLLAA